MNDSVSRAEAEKPQATELCFVMDGEVVRLTEVEPTLTVLQLLRERLDRMGTKEGCAEGDCGACTVVVGELAEDGGKLSHRAVNACIQLAPTLHGKQLITVESLCSKDGELHPVQRAMVEHHGSQCGFCTPGIVMSLFCLHRSDPRPSRRAVEVALSGNLCRCTGYRPIVAAAQSLPEQDGRVEADYRFGRDATTASALQQISPLDALHLQSAGGSFLSPVTLDALAQALIAEPGSLLLAGGTDVGLWVTKQLKEFSRVVHLGRVAELQRLVEQAGYLEVGAAVCLTDASEHLLRHYPELRELFERFASPPIRNAATLCGNIANGSPIGDSIPALLALDAEVKLRQGESSRNLPLDGFYRGYRNNILRPGEFIEAVRVPLPSLSADLNQQRILRVYKVSKRFDQDISAVCGAFHLQLERGRVAHARIAYGGMGPTAARAIRTEQALLGRDWSEASVRVAMAHVESDCEPIDDLRASAAYRRLVAQNLLYRCYLETTQVAVGERLYQRSRPRHG